MVNYWYRFRLPNEDLVGCCSDRGAEYARAYLASLGHHMADAVLESVEPL